MSEKINPDLCPMPAKCAASTDCKAPTICSRRALAHDREVEKAIATLQNAERDDELLEQPRRFRHWYLPIGPMMLANGSAPGKIRIEWIEGERMGEGGDFSVGEFIQAVEAFYNERF